MSDQVQKNMQVLRHWLDTLNKGDITEIKKAWDENAISEDYVLHDPSQPSFSIGVEDAWKGVESFLQNFAGYRIHVQDMFGLEDQVVTRATIEPGDASAPEKQKIMVIVISRFKNGKLIEEWQVAQPIADLAA